MNWKILNSEEQLEQIKARSLTTPQVIFKHSTRCATSSMIRTRLERSSTMAAIDFHFLDLIKYRHLSDRIAEEFSVYHESPQVLLIRNGECIYDESHNGIMMDEIVNMV
jgi:bacillithiol system protein YtxJ